MKKMTIKTRSSSLLAAELIDFTFIVTGVKDQERPTRVD